MNIALTFKNFEPSDHLRKYATRRFEKLGRFIPKADNVEMTVVLTVDKFRHKADVQLTGDGLSVSAMEQSSDMYATVDMVLDKLGAQLKKHAEKIKEKRRSAGRAATEVADSSAFDGLRAEDDEAPSLVITEESVEPKPMYAEEAALQLSHRDEAVLIFLNAVTERVNVIYKRKQGDYGLIDLEM